MIRTVKPEILDRLPENHPDALHNRRDLLIFNHLMGNFRWFYRELKKRLDKDDHLLEIGSGIGDLGRWLYPRVLNKQDVLYDGLDQFSRPKNWPELWKWHQVDLRSFDGYDRYNIVLANLVLHQFKDQELHRLGQEIGKRAKLILISEPARRNLHLFQLKFARLLRTSYVTNHDARVSIEAGFINDELPKLLGLDLKQWECNCEVGFLGQYRMIAVKK